MGVIPVDGETDAVISEIARKLHTSKDEVIKMLLEGELKPEGGMNMDPEMERKIAEILGKKESGGMIDKMIEMKMLEKMDSRGDSGDNMKDLLEIMKLKMMMEAMHEKKNDSIDPNMILLLYLMKGDSGKADMTKIIETVTASTQTKDDAMKDLLKQLLEEKKETEKEEELMSVIEQQEQMIEQLKKEIEDTRRMVYSSVGGKKPRDDDVFGAVGKIEKMKDTFERLGLTKPPSSEDRELAIKQDVVKAKARLEEQTMEKTSDIVDKVLDGVDRKMDKVLSIVETLMKQPAGQREQTLEDFERRGQITPTEKQLIYQKMQEEAMREATYAPPEPQNVQVNVEPKPEQKEMSEEEKAEKARMMWAQGYNATQIARALHMSVTETYKYRPKV